MDVVVRIFLIVLMNAVDQQKRIVMDNVMVMLLLMNVEYVVALVFQAVNVIAMVILKIV